MIFFLADINWGIQSRAAWIAVILLAVACVLASVWIYRKQGPTIPQFWRDLMASLRAAALVAICISLLQPTAVRPLRSDEAGGVAILIDQSKSMSAIDSADLPAEQVAAADALHLLPTSARDQKIETVRYQVEQIIPLLDEIRRATAERQYAMLIDQSAQGQHQTLDDLATRLRTAAEKVAQEPMAHSLADLPQRIDSPQRLNQARKKVDTVLSDLTRAQRTSDDNLYRDNPDVRKACQSLASMNRLERAKLATNEIVAQLPPSVPIYGGFFDSGLEPALLRKNSQLNWPANIHPAGNRSDISGALRDLFSRMAGQRLRAVLVLTDGRQVGGSVGALPESPPIFPVLCASRPIDLAISRISCPSAAYLDEPIAIDAQIRAVNLAELPINISLRTANLTQRQAIDLDRAGSATAHFVLPLQHAGDQIIQINIDPIPGEASIKNNIAEFHVRVSPQRLKITLLATFPNRDFEFLHADLKRTPWIDTRVVLPGGQIAPAELLQQQVILIDDLAAHQLSTDQWTAIHEFASHGGGLVFVAGANHLPAEYLTNPHLADLLPFSGNDEPVWRTWAGEDAYFRFAPADPDLPMLNFAGYVARQWADLPGMYHYLRMPVLKDGVQPLLIERESGSPVLTENHYGAGRVFLVGFNETWRWRSVSPQVQQNFWLQLLRHAAPVSDAVHAQVPNLELADLEPDPSFLARLASNSGGDVLTIPEVGQTWNKTEQYQRAHPDVVEYPLWHSPWLFALVIGCLGAEWGLRKRFGLA